MQRPTGVTVAAFSAFGLATIGIILSTYLLVWSTRIGLVAFGISMSFLELLFAAIYVAAGFGLWKLKNWGRVLTIVIATYWVASIIGRLFARSGLIGPYILDGSSGKRSELYLEIAFTCMAACVWVIWYLFRPQVRQAFRQG
jgi:hypothetical protein